MPVETIIEVSGKDYHLVETCGGCPEQYDVFDDERQKVGYLRLRHGHFSVEIPDCGGEVVYTAKPEGDGIFETEERGGYLRAAVGAIHRRVTGDQRDAAMAARRLNKFAASLTNASMLRDIETVRNAGGGGVTTAPSHLYALRSDLVAIIDTWEERR